MKLKSLILSLSMLALAACNKPQQAPATPAESSAPAAEATQSAPETKSEPAPAATPAPKAPDVKTTTTAAGVMVLVPAGSFMMGDDKGDADERPAHKVTVSAFYMDQREVSQMQYQALMQKNPSKFKGPDRPVEQIDWYHAVLYCNMRSAKEGLKPCYDPKTLVCDFDANGYRLPTEAEWEYACRAGSTAKYSFGDSPISLGSYGWFKVNSNRASHPVGQKAPNAFGLFDMHGNVSEWCNDTYDEKYYEQMVEKNPRGPNVNDKRVLRGGGWNANAEGCRSAIRYRENARFADACFGSEAYGFRCVKNAK